MLQCDTYRGSHSTGAFAGFKLTADWQYNLAKAAVDGFDFVKSKTYLETIRCHREERYYASVAKPTVVSTSPRFIFGHNRYATVGAVNGKNAHPFQHGNITLAHNGTLIDQSLLPDHTMFEVDSENVCHSVNKIGAAETIQKLDGAFTLIWHDKSDNTVHVIRNEERPFHFWETPSGDWFGCSEEKMGDWLLSRGNSPISIKRHFEAEVGTEYVFDVDGGFKLVNEIKHTLPVFTRVVTTRSSGYRGYSAWDDYEDTYGYGTWNSYRENKAHLPAITGIDRLFQTYGVDFRVGDKIEMYAYHADKVEKDPNNLVVTGCLPTYSSTFIEASCIMKDTEYLPDRSYKGEVISAYEQQHVLIVLLKDPVLMDENGNTVIDPPSDDGDDGASETLSEMSTMDLSTLLEDLEGSLGELDDDIPFDLETRKIPDTNEYVTRAQWGNHTMTACAHCSNEIAFEDIEDCENYQNQLVCPDCCASLSEEVEDSNYFCCTGCAQELPEKVRSPDYPLMCKTCASMFKSEPVADVTPIVRRSTVTGMSLTPNQWARMNSCSICGFKIPFYLIETTKFLGSAPVCENCESKLKK